ncbi:MAG: hypothetical protein AAFV49_11450, partial [Pseudomonadota bacterium]
RDAGAHLARSDDAYAADLHDPLTPGPAVGMASAAPVDLAAPASISGPPGNATPNASPPSGAPPSIPIRRLLDKFVTDRVIWNDGGGNDEKH